MVVCVKYYLAIVVRQSMPVKNCSVVKNKKQKNQAQDGNNKNESISGTLRQRIMFHLKACRLKRQWT